MGLDINGTRFLIYAKTQGVSFARTAMLGRQRLMLSANALINNLTDFGHATPQEDHVRKMMGGRGGYAEPFIEALGAEEIHSFDASDYEGASDIVDFNFPIEERFKNRFTAVLDGGALEHIFNFPIAIRNCMEMLRAGGHFLGITPTNNFSGHGFYQFSPELLFRIFSRPNGFKIVRMIAFEDRADAEWHEVTDPDTIGERVTLVNNRPAYLLVIAEKVESARIFAAPPQQSDYARMWESSDTKSKSSTAPETATPAPGTESGSLTRVLHGIYARAPAPLKSIFRAFRSIQQHSAFNKPKFFKRMRLP